MKKLVIIIVAIGICLAIISNALTHNEPIIPIQKTGIITYTDQQGKVSILCEDGNIYELINKYNLQVGDRVCILFDDKHTETVEDDEIINIRRL